jgi:hypothetical protein
MRCRSVDATGFSSRDDEEIGLPQGLNMSTPSWTSDLVSHVDTAARHGQYSKFGQPRMPPTDERTSKRSEMSSRTGAFTRNRIVTDADLPWRPMDPDHSAIRRNETVNVPDAQPRLFVPCNRHFDGRLRRPRQPVSSSTRQPVRQPVKRETRPQGNTKSCQTPTSYLSSTSHSSLPTSLLHSLQWPGPPGIRRHRRRKEDLQTAAAKRRFEGMKSTFNA